jgi:methyl-accepting chemotaxis protein
MPTKSDRLAQSAAVVRNVSLVIDSYRHANHANLSPDDYDRLADAVDGLSNAAASLAAASTVATFDELSAGLDQLDAATTQLKNDIQQLEDTANSVASAFKLVGAAESIADAFTPFDLGKIITAVQGLQS